MEKLKTGNSYVGELVCDIKILSKREAEVAALLCKRLNAVEIVTVLLISPRTVEQHIANIYEKMKVRNRRGLLLKLLGK
jgi:DNA-binding CsgD family transcriptional regulator